jgi:hypothetical protein
VSALLARLSSAFIVAADTDQVVAVLLSGSQHRRTAWGVP